MIEREKEKERVLLGNGIGGSSSSSKIQRGRIVSQMCDRVPPVLNK